ncbi:hypothetical protein [Gluconobacter kondonii]|uniref:hypothetical protein n=1 Tax=Gluconobacter kondonii TaxID=941463 RepID=UPI00201102BC|nr:hypothetical protein [Gluconobacter kondonii]
MRNHALPSGCFAGALLLGGSAQADVSDAKQKKHEEHKVGKEKDATPGVKNLTVLDHAARIAPATIPLGIPFGDATDLHHTTLSLFISHFLGETQIDRGPGTGSTIGNATFGGTMGFTSKTPPAKRGVSLYRTYGSFNTRAGGIEFDSGKTRFGRAFLDMQHEETNGYLTNSAERRSNLMFKDVIDLAPETTLTLETTYNKEWQ